MLRSIFLTLLLVTSLCASAASMTVPSGATCTFTTSGTNVTITCAAVVTPVDPTTPADPVIPGCSTKATYTGNFDREVHKVFRLRSGESAAMSFRTYAHALSPTGAIKLSTIETTSTPLTADHEIRLSKCPGDFNRANCGGWVMFNGGSMNVSVNASPGACLVLPGQTYYMNVRQVKRGTTVPSCELQDGCDVDLGIQNYRP